jgi:putative MATE family efflux protein
MQKEKPREINPVTEGPLFKAILLLALPATASMAARSIEIMYDAAIVGSVGPQALAALTAGTFFLWIMISCFHTVSVGTNALVARFIGAGEKSKAELTASTGLIGGIVFSLVLGMLLFLFAPNLAATMSLIGNTYFYCVQYLRMLGLGMPVLFTAFVVESIFRGAGDTKTPMVLLLLMAAQHVIYAPLFVFGIGFFPELGIAGVPLAMTLASTTSVLFGFYFLRLKGLTPRLREFAFDRRIFKDIVRIGIPTALSGIMFSLVYIPVANVTVRFGDEALAALGIGHRVESVSYMVAVGFSYAAATVVGQNLGAKKPSRAERGAWLAALMMILYCLLTGLAFFLFSNEIARIFGSDPLQLSLASLYLRIIAISQWAMALEVVLDGAFGGAGDTVPPLVIGGPVTLLRIPLAYFLAVTLGWGAAGVFWTITLTSLAKGIILALLFARGKWKTKLDKQMAVIR